MKNSVWGKKTRRACARPALAGRLGWLPSPFHHQQAQKSRMATNRSHPSAQPPAKVSLVSLSGVSSDSHAHLPGIPQLLVTDISCSALSGHRVTPTCDRASTPDHTDLACPAEPAAQTEGLRNATRQSTFSSLVPLSLFQHRSGSILCTIGLTPRRTMLSFTLCTVWRACARLTGLGEADRSALRSKKCRRMMRASTSRPEASADLRVVRVLCLGGAWPMARRSHPSVGTCESGWR